MCVTIISFSNCLGFFLLDGMINVSFRSDYFRALVKRHQQNEKADLFLILNQLLLVTGT